uniref:Putative secreted peptide n=1 Tax=Anopheles braziliensis TaxID=58242 RepID=A0A2M3ZXM9_9DIPT
MLLLDVWCFWYMFLRGRPLLSRCQYRVFLLGNLTFLRWVLCRCGSFLSRFPCRLYLLGRLPILVRV